MADGKDGPGVLEPSPEALRSMIEAATERLLEHLTSLPEQPVSDVDGAAEIAARLRSPLPESGTPFEELLDLVFGDAVAKTYNTASPGYLAFVPGGGLPHAAVADLVAAGINRFVGVWQAAPGLVQLEADAVRWLAEIVGYPEESLGTLTSGGSLANFGAVVTARRTRLGDDLSRGTLYVSDQVHHSMAKAAVLAGFPPEAIRAVPSDDRQRLGLDALAAAVREDRSRGRRPFFVATSAGTTNTGAVDDLEGAADLARELGLWHHVDAAYGGFFCLTERGRRKLSGIERADSVVLDPHKGLFLPYGTGSLLVRDGAALRRAHTFGADYLPTLQESRARVDFCSLSPELSRPFRGLAAWLALRLVGLGAFREALDEKLDLAALAAEELATVPGIEIVAPPELSLFAFRLVPPGAGPEEGDVATRRLLDEVNRRQRVFLTGTSVGGRFVGRMCILSFRTHEDRVRMAIEDVREAAGMVRERRA